MSVELVEMEENILIKTVWFCCHRDGWKCPKVSQKKSFFSWLLHPDVALKVFALGATEKARKHIFFWHLGWNILS